MKINDMDYKKFSLFLGFMVWLMATIAFRFAGQYFFLTDNTLVMVGLYILVVPVLGVLANWVFNSYQLGRLESIQSATLIVLPGMAFDTFIIIFFPVVLPNLPPTDAPIFGSWLMWAYASVLAFGLTRKESS
ncbi:DUF5367 domain-containing protein [Aquiflexum lacus]|uniref:DUF5367 domain-containing protein n=1 Tax=Aquiflexum lacus TaxID=2483805 RepID=UPI0018958336|nr:DUF5367 domain-containing protein [Aquiflexum lacus]